MNAGQFKSGEMRLYAKVCATCSVPFTGTNRARYCDGCAPRTLNGHRANTATQVRCPKCKEMRTVRAGSLHKHGYEAAADGVFERGCLNCLNDGVPVRRTSKASLLRLRDREWLAAAYAEHSSNEIGAMLDCNFGLVCVWLRKHGIERRSVSDALRLANGKKGYKGRRNRQMVTAGVADVPVRITQKDWVGG